RRGVRRDSRARHQGSEERLRASWLREAGAGESQGADGAQSADGRADQDPREPGGQVPAREEREGRGAWEEVSPTPPHRPCPRLPHGPEGPAAPSLARARPPGVWEGIGYRPLPVPAAARALFDFAAVPWPDTPLALAWGAFAAGARGERLVGAVAGEPGRRPPLLPRPPPRPHAPPRRPPPAPAPLPAPGRRS